MVFALRFRFLVVKGGVSGLHEIVVWLVESQAKTIPRMKPSLEQFLSAVEARSNTEMKWCTSCCCCCCYS